MAALAAWYLSGGAANASPTGSLGGVISTTQAGVNLFDDVTGDESAVGDTEYRGIYVKNDGNVTLQNAVVWVQVNTPDTETAISIAVATEAINVPMASVANENTAPVGPAFTAPASKATGLALGTIPAGQFRGVWIKRVINAGAVAYNNDTFTLRVEGDSGA